MTEEVRTETGGPARTPRSEITSAAVSANRKKEPVLLLDLSTLMDWDAAVGGPEWNGTTGGRRGVVIEALHGLVVALEDEDSEAATEQADGIDERGGLLCHRFADGHVEIGDLNSANWNGGSPRSRGAVQRTSCARGRRHWPTSRRSSGIAIRTNGRSC